jgi:hypothetical protein
VGNTACCVSTGTGDFDGIICYQKVVVALKETIRLMAEIDEIIPRWPVE